MSHQPAKHAGEQLRHWRDGLRRPATQHQVLSVKVHSEAECIFVFKTFRRSNSIRGHNFNLMALQALTAVQFKRQQGSSKVALQKEVLAWLLEQCRGDLDEHGAACICARHATAKLQRRAAHLLQLHAEATAGVVARRHKLQVCVHVLRQAPPLAYMSG